MYNETSATCVKDLKKKCNATCAQDSTLRKYHARQEAFAMGFYSLSYMPEVATL